VANHLLRDDVGEILDYASRNFISSISLQYLCYIFYSIHTGLSGILEILRDQWKNARTLFAEEKSRLKTIFMLFEKVKGLVTA